VNEEGNTNRLKIIRAKKSGKRFVGCEGYPECDQTYGIPQRGDLIRLEANCSICGETPRLKVWTGRRPWNLCLNENCPSMVEMRAQRAEREAAREAKEAAAAAAAGADAPADGASPEEAPAEKAPAKEPAEAGTGSGNGTRRRPKTTARS
jgi:DNA topoisomerase-1